MWPNLRETLCCCISLFFTSLCGSEERWSSSSNYQRNITSLFCCWSHCPSHEGWNHAVSSGWNKAVLLAHNPPLRHNKNRKPNFTCSLICSNQLYVTVEGKYLQRIKSSELSGGLESPEIQFHSYHSDVSACSRGKMRNGDGKWSHLFMHAKCPGVFFLKSQTIRVVLAPELQQILN